MSSLLHPSAPFGAWRLACITVLAGTVGCTSAPPPHSILMPSADAEVRHWMSSQVVENRRAIAGAPIDASQLTAEDVLAAAIAFNPRMKLARAQKELGVAGVIIARERVNPTLSLSPERVISAVTGVSPWVLAVSLVWPMRTAGKRQLVIEQALAAGESAQLNAAAIVWSLRVDARAAVCGLEFAQLHRDLVAEEAALRSDLVVRLEKQADAGIVSRYEVARARLDRDASVQRVGLAEAAILAARHDLAALTGLPMSQVDLRSPAHNCVSGEIGQLQQTPELKSHAIGRRLDFRAKLAEFRGADTAWRAEIAKRYPDLSIGPGYIYDQGVRKVTFSLSFELPILSRNAGNIAKARAERDRLAAEAEILQDSVRAEVSKAVDQYLQARRQLTLSQSLRAAAKSLLDRDVERERSGEIDRPAVLLSRIGFLTAQADELTATRLVFDAQTMLEMATQTPLSAPEFNTEAAIAILKTP